MNIQVLNNYDPTKTTTLRNAFSRAMKKRFRIIRGLIRKAVVEEDCFGLTTPQNVVRLGLTGNAATPGRNAFAFATSGEKVDRFMEWLEDQVDRNILETSTIPQLGQARYQQWTDMYIDSAYRKGTEHARQKLIQQGYSVPGIEETGGIDAVMRHPMHADRVGLLYTRTYQDLKNITRTMEGQLSRVLAQSMAEGRNPNDIAQILTRTISGPFGDLGITDTLGRFIPAERRATILARTEIIRAHHSATIQEYRNWGAEGVTVIAEWSTAGDERVCAECDQLANQRFSLDEIEGMIPLHPQCRCIAIPVDKTKEGSAISAGPVIRDWRSAYKGNVDLKEMGLVKRNKGKITWDGKEAGFRSIKLNKAARDSVEPFSDIIKTEEEMFALSDMSEDYLAKYIMEQFNIDRLDFIDFADVQGRTTALRKMAQSLSRMYKDMPEKTLKKLATGKKIHTIRLIGKRSYYKGSYTLDIDTAGDINGSLVFGRADAAGVYHHKSAKHMQVYCGSLKEPGLRVGGEYVLSLDNNMEAIFRHEYGHHLSITLGNKISNGMFSRWQKLFESKPTQYWESTVSKYGASSYKELFAEAWSVYTHSDYQKGILPPEIEEFFEKFYK